MTVQQPRRITQEQYDKQTDKIIERLKADPSKIAPFLRSYCCTSLTRQERAKLVKEAKADVLELIYMVQEYMDTKFIVAK